MRDSTHKPTVLVPTIRTRTTRRRTLGRIRFRHRLPLTSVTFWSTSWKSCNRWAAIIQSTTQPPVLKLVAWIWRSMPTSLAFHKTLRSLPPITIFLEFASRVAPLWSSRLTRNIPIKRVSGRSTVIAIRAAKIASMFKNLRLSQNLPWPANKLSHSVSKKITWIWVRAARRLKGSHQALSRQQCETRTYLSRPSEILRRSTKKPLSLRRGLNTQSRLWAGSYRRGRANPRRSDIRCPHTTSPLA